MLRLPLSALPLTVSISAGCLALILFASLFHHERVVSFSENVAIKAKLSFEEVMRQRLEYGNLHHHHHHSSGDDNDLEPEWEWARDVSIVYTWINGSDPVHIEKKKKLGLLMDGERDRDNDDLKHSLRSLNKMIKWHTGTVYIVTPPGQVPNWLDTSNPRIRMINQDDLLDPFDIPTFNSNCLESWLHQIPGLSSKFIVLNDDYYFGRIIHPSDFFFLHPTRSSNTTLNNAGGEKKEKNGNIGKDDDDGDQTIGIKMFLEPWSYGVAEKWHGGGQWSDSVRYTAKLVKETYGELFHEETRITEHGPFVYDKRAFEGIHQRFNLALRRTCQNKIRAPDDAIPPFLHNEWVIQEGSRCCGIRYQTVSGQSRYFQWELDLHRNEVEFKRVINMKPTFFNINDKMGYDPKNIDRIQKASQQMKDMLEEWLPEPSEFEIQ